MWSPENDMKENKMGNTWHALLNISSIFLLKSHTQSYHPTSLRKRMGVWEVYPKTILKLPQNWEICIEKGGSNNFTQITAIQGNLYWKHCQLINVEVFLDSNLNFTIRVFTWCLANDDNICKKIFCSFWSIIQ